MSFASPGGVRISSAKKRRLSALDAALDAALKPTSGNKKAKQTGQGKEVKVSAKTSTQGPSHRTNEQNIYEPQYNTLDSSIITGPLSQALPALQLQPNKSVNLILEEAMQTNSRAPDTQAAIASRVQNKVLMLDNPTANLLTKARGTGNHKKVASHLLPCSKRPKIGSTPCRYSKYEPMHKLWTQYIGELLHSSSNKQALLLEADYHGCQLTVKQSLNPRHVGLTGYVVTETKTSFALLGKDDRLHHVLKKDAVFQFVLDDAHQVTVFGSELMKHR